MSYTPRDGDPVLPLFSLKGKSAIVTGAGAGIGYAVADCFAEAGADVIIWYNSNPKAHEAAEEIANRWSVKCKAFKVDVTDQQAVDSAVKEQVEGELGGRLDIFVANAGIPWTKGAILDVGQEGVRYNLPFSSLDILETDICIPVIRELCWMHRLSTTRRLLQPTLTASTTPLWQLENTSRSKAVVPSSPRQACLDIL